jgi:SRSO17 transposase
MEGTPADGWEDELEGWLEPFLGRLRRQAQRRWAPFYLKGLILPGERKSIEPMAARVAPGDVQQLHHFVSTSPWATAPVEEELVRAADRLVGGSDAVLVVDDTALVKQGRHSVGVKRQYCGQLGKRANCQALVSLTLARAEMPVCIGLRLFLPEDWSAGPARRAVVGVPGAIGYRPKWQIGLDEIDRVLASGARFGCVLADAEYGKAAEFRHGLSERNLPWAVGILPTQKVYPADVTPAHPTRKATGAGRASTPCPRWRARARPSCSRHGRSCFVPSPGGLAPRARSKPGSPRSGYAWPTGRSWPERSTCRAKKPGWWASTVPPASASTT